MSQLSDAQKSTVFTKAEGSDLDALSSRLLGLSRPLPFSRGAWKKLLKALVYQPRGTFSCVFEVLDAMFSEYTSLTAFDVSIVDYTITDSRLNASYAQRYARFTESSTQKETIVWIEDATAGSATLCPLSSSYFKTIEDGQGTLEILPFVLFERRNTLYFYLDVEMVSPPPTFLQESGGARPASQPFGGHLLNLFDLDSETLDYGDQVNGPFPLYLDSIEISGVLKHVLPKLLRAGVKFEAQAKSWGDDLLGFGGLSSIPRYGVVGYT